MDEINAKTWESGEVVSSAGYGLFLTNADATEPGKRLKSGKDQVKWRNMGKDLYSVQKSPRSRNQFGPETYKIFIELAERVGIKPIQ